jgi:hypothetical protein
MAARPQHNGATKRDGHLPARQARRRSIPAGQRRWERDRVRWRTGVCHIHPLGQALEGGGELGGEIAGGPERIPITGIETVVTAPDAEHHRRLLKKVPVDGDLHTLDGEGDGLQPGRVGVAGLLARSALAQAEDVGDHARTFRGEGLGG